VTFTTEDISPTRKAVNITIPATTLAGYEKDILKEYAREVRIPGFRPGKVPEDLVRRQFAKSIADELKTKAVSEALRHVTDEAKLEVYAIVSAKGAETLAPGTDATLSLELDLLPRFELPEYKDLDLPEEPVDVTDDEVRQAVEALRNHHARYEIADRPAQKGDYVKLAYSGTIDGTAIKDIAPDAHLYGTQNATWEEAGADPDKAGAGIPEIVAGIVGKKTGDKAGFTHEFPADFAIDDLKGKKALYATEILEVRSKTLPELDEEFFKAVKAADLDALRKQMRDGILSRKESEARAQRRQAALEALAAKVDFALPESAIDREGHNMFLELAELRRQQGASLDEIGEKYEETLASTKEAARTRLKTQFILGKIAEKENLAVTSQELSQRIVYESHLARVPAPKYLKELAKDRERLNTLRTWILCNKALDLVIASAKK
jgi:trigger factor